MSACCRDCPRTCTVDTGGRWDEDATVVACPFATYDAGFVMGILESATDEAAVDVCRKGWRG